MVMRRWLIANKLYASLFIIIAIFAYLDSVQIKPFLIIDTPQAWDLYNTFTGPSFWYLWFIVMVIIGFVYFLFTRDKSESLGLVLGGSLLLWFAVEDVFFFLFSEQPMTQCMQWFNDLNPQLTFWSTNILGETCVSPLALVSFAILGIFVSYYVFQRLKVAKW